jgi:hypothetical protein
MSSSGSSCSSPWSISSTCSTTGGTSLDLVSLDSGEKALHHQPLGPPTFTLDLVGEKAGRAALHLDRTSAARGSTVGALWDERLRCRPQMSGLEMRVADRHARVAVAEHRHHRALRDAGHGQRAGDVVA